MPGAGRDERRGSLDSTEGRAARGRSIPCAGVHGARARSSHASGTRLEGNRLVHRGVARARSVSAGHPLTFPGGDMASTTTAEGTAHDRGITAKGYARPDVLVSTSWL